MKFIYSLLTFAITLGGCLTSKTEPTGTFANREGDVRVEVCSRGCYQFILQPIGKDSARSFYVANFPDSLQSFALNAHNEGKKLRVFFSGKTTGSKQTIQKAGADDRPVPLYELPSMQVANMSRFR